MSDYTYSMKRESIHCRLQPMFTGQATPDTTDIRLHQWMETGDRGVCLSLASPLTHCLNLDTFIKDNQFWMTSGASNRRLEMDSTSGITMFETC